MPDPVLAEAERDVHELEQYVAIQHTRANDLRTAGRDDEERKAREGLLLLADALEIARQRLRASATRAASNLNSAAVPMRLWKMLALGIVLLSASPAAAQDQPQTTLVPCDAFKKNPDGSWSPVRQVVIAGPTGHVTVSPARSFWPAVAYMGIDLGSRLEQQCKRHGAARARGAPYLAAWPSGTDAPM
jgi:hypothetical protein